MIILLLLTALFATIAVTIAAGLGVLVVYLWRKYMIALRALQVLNNGYQSLSVENAYLRSLRSAATDDEPERDDSVIHEFIN